MKENWIYILVIGIIAYFYFHKTTISSVASSTTSTVSGSASTLPILATGDILSIISPGPIDNPDATKTQNLIDALGPQMVIGGGGGGGGDVVVSGIGSDMSKMPFECLSYIGMISPYPECNTINPGMGEPFGHGGDLAY